MELFIELDDDLFPKEEDEKGGDVNVRYLCTDTARSDRSAE